MALIAAILEVAGRDMEASEAEDDHAVLSTSEGLAVDLTTAHHMTTEDFPTSHAAWSRWTTSSTPSFSTAPRPRKAAIGFG